MIPRLKCSVSFSLVNIKSSGDSNVRRRIYYVTCLLVFIGCTAQDMPSTEPKVSGAEISDISPPVGQWADHDDVDIRQQLMRLATLIHDSTIAEDARLHRMVEYAEIVNSNSLTLHDLLDNGLFTKEWCTPLQITHTSMMSLPPISRDGAVCVTLKPTFSKERLASVLVIVDVTQVKASMISGHVEKYLECKSTEVASPLVLGLFVLTRRGTLVTKASDFSSLEEWQRIASGVP